MADMMQAALEEQAALEREMDQQMASLDMDAAPSPGRGAGESDASTPRRTGGGGGDKPVSAGAYEGNYTGSEEEIICMWIKELVGKELDPANLQEGLKNGVALCELVNRISPKAVRKVNHSEMPFAQRENIQSFCDAMKALGVKDINNFAADDLFEGKRMKQVVIGVFALGKQAWFVPDYSGPALGKPEIQPYEAPPGLRTPSQGSFRLGTEASKPPLPSSESFNRKYKWEVKAGGSYVPAVPAAAKREAEERDKEEHRHQRKWEVKFAPQLATATRRTIVVSSDVQNLMDKFSNESQLRTAVDRSQATSTDVGGKVAAAEHYKKPDSAPNPTVPKPHPPREKEHKEREAPKVGAVDGLQVGESGAPPPDPDAKPPVEEEEAEEEEEEEGEAYRGVPPAGVVEGLMMMLTSPDATEKAKAAAALCNICSETDSNRELVVHAGGLPSLIDMLKHPSPEVPFMQSAAAACICNLAANINSKEVIATSGALEVLVKVLRSENQAAAAQAAGALWSLCVDNDMNKQRVADAGAIPHLITLLHAPDTFAQSQSAGALSECSIRNDNNKRLISEHGAILPLVKMLRSQDLSVQRLSSCALCNVCANHEANKRQAREVGALPVLVHLLSSSQVPEVLSPVAGAICNLSMKCQENKAEFIRLGATDVLRHLVTSPIPSLHGNALAALEQLELG